MQDQIPSTIQLHYFLGICLKAMLKEIEMKTEWIVQHDDEVMQLKDIWVANVKYYLSMTIHL